MNLELTEEQATLMRLWFKKALDDLKAMDDSGEGDYHSDLFRSMIIIPLLKQLDIHKCVPEILEKLKEQTNET